MRRYAYIACSTSPRRDDPYQVPFIDLAQRMLAGLSRNYADSTLLCNWAGLTPQIEGMIRTAWRKDVEFFAIPETQWKGREIYAKVERLQEMPIEPDSHVVMMDVDMLVLRPIADAFEAEFDLGYTSRPLLSRYMPLNSGFLALRWTEATRRFVKKWAEEINDPSWPPFVAYRKRLGHDQRPQWWVDQDFLCACAESGPPPDAPVQMHDLGRMYNWFPDYPADPPLARAWQEMMEGLVSGAKVLHFKGFLKPLMAAIPEDGMISNVALA